MSVVESRSLEGTNLWIHALARCHVCANCVDKADDVPCDCPEYVHAPLLSCTTGVRVADRTKCHRCANFDGRSPAARQPGDCLRLNCRAIVREPLPLGAPKDLISLDRYWSNSGHDDNGDLDSNPANDDVLNVYTDVTDGTSEVSELPNSVRNKRDRSSYEGDDVQPDAEPKRVRFGGAFIGSSSTLFTSKKRAREPDEDDDDASRAPSEPARKLKRALADGPL